jgi:hypothetical protein
MKPAKLVSITKAAELIGRDPQWLRRLLLRRERELGQRLMVRTGEGKKRPTYLVSLSTLRLYEPGLFDKRDDVQAALKKLVDTFAARVDELEERIDDMQASMGKLGDRVREALDRIGQQPRRSFAP